MEIDIQESSVPELHLSDLQKRASELIDNIRDVDEDIRKVTGRNFSELRRRFGARGSRRNFDRTNPTKDSENSNYDKSDSKRRKSSFNDDVSEVKHSAHDRIPSHKKDKNDEKDKSNENKDNRENSPIPIMSEVVRDEKTELIPTEPAEPVLDEETCKRSKRMFGHLLGTLKKFKIENESQKDISLKRQEIDKKLEERDIKEHEAALAQKKELLALRLEKQRDLRTLRRQIWLKELEEKTKEYFELISHAIMVGGEQPLFYMPAKHSPATLLMLEKSREVLEKRKDEYVKIIPDLLTKNEIAHEEPGEEVGEKENTSGDTSSNEDEEVKSNSVEKVEEKVAEVQ